jgi:hypothetical protein
MGFARAERRTAESEARLHPLPGFFLAELKIRS